MANLLDYLDWRGDLTFRQAPFNEVDNLILSELSYLDFGGIVPGLGVGEAVCLRDVAEEFFARWTEEERSLGVLLPEEIPEMLYKMSRSIRYRDLKLSCYTQVQDTENARQFAAVVIELEKRQLYVSYRGTDDTLAGWREDFYMACMPEIPAQKLAVGYLKAVAKQYPGYQMQVGGHSKGGNLAVYSAVFCPQKVQKRIRAVWSNDGPGFFDHILSLPEYERMADRIVTILPKSSLVGMLLEHEEEYVVVDSDAEGLFQHDGFTWKVMGAGFIRLHEVTRQGKIHDMVMREWVKSLSLEQRRTFVNALFDTLEASGAKTLTDLKEDRLKAAEGILRAMKDMDKPTRTAVGEAIKQLLHSSVKVRWEELQQESEKIEWPKWLPSRNETEK